MPVRKYLDLLNQRFGSLTVVRLSYVKKDISQPMWRCICDCGKSKIVSSDNLINKNTTNCGFCDKEIKLPKRRPKSYNKDKRSKGKEQFVKEAIKIWGDRFDYSKVNYFNNYTPIIIICSDHGDFYQTPKSHLAGSDCDYCRDEKRSKTKQGTNEDIDNYLLINNIHIKRIGDRFIYRKDKNSKGISKIKCQCENCEHIWETKVNSIKDGKGCPNCARGKNEKIVEETLVEIKINYEKQFMFIYNKRKYFADFWLPDYNLFIEYNGEQHYKPVRFYTMTDDQMKFNFDKQQKRDKELKEYCKENNINLLEIDGRKYTNTKLRKFIKAYFTK